MNFSSFLPPPPSSPPPPPPGDSDDDDDDDDDDGQEQEEEEEIEEEEQFPDQLMEAFEASDGDQQHSDESPGEESVADSVTDSTAQLVFSSNPEYDNSPADLNLETTEL